MQILITDKKKSKSLSKNGSSTPIKNWYKEIESRFATFPAHIQILNMMSDLKKAAQLNQTSQTSSTNHLYRAIILLDYMVDDPKWKPKLRELLRLREVIGSLIFEKQPYATIEQTIQAALLLEPAAYKAVK